MGLPRLLCLLAMRVFLDGAFSGCLIQHSAKAKTQSISKTSVCPLAKVVRKELGKRGIKHLKVVYSKETPKKFDNSEEFRRTPASISFVPSVSGLIIASEVVKDLIVQI